MPSVDWHSIEAEDALKRLESSSNGLASADALKRQAEFGPNIIPEKRKRSVLGMLLRQFSDFMIVVLLVAALISGFIGEPQDTIAILVIVLLNAIIGTIQEYRAERAVAALRQMAAPETEVLRDGQSVTLAAADLVPGDVVLLQAGNIVPADLRLLEVEGLQADESALTGESHPVEKQSERLSEADPALGDRKSMAFKSSLITRGRASGVVVATGLETEIGNIASLLGAEKDVKTPLQVRLTRFGRYLALAVLAICAVVFAAGLLQGQPMILMFLTAVSLGVAAIPEALPAVVTISLALGARKLIRHHALVRNLPAVETLGSVTYICTDKTGTLTQNQMNVELIYIGNERRELSDDVKEDKSCAEMFQAMALNNDVQDKDGKPAGEPTELALFETAEKYGFNKEALEKEFPRLDSIPFDSTRKQMTTLHQTEGAVVAYVKGSPEKVLSQCNSMAAGEETTTFDLESALKAASELAGEGYRVLAFAKRELTSLPEPVVAENVEQDLIFLGFVALIDPPRTEVPQAVADCLTAGITPVMITGDHPGTALAIAKRLGIAQNDQEMLSGEELAKLSDEKFASMVETIRVYARVNPKQKVRIVKALQANGEFVAMTG
ncbi:MAG TPA: HAD-IC family P-type ATPase, partial [Gammaproteobacteria bacterium]